MYKAKKEIVRKYYKYQYSSWTQPALISNISDNCNVTFSASYNVNYDGYKALDGNNTDCWFPNAVTGWWQIKFPYKIKITGLKHIAGAYNKQTQGIKGRYYTSDNKTTPIGNEINGSYAQGTVVTIQNIPSEGIVTDTIYFDKTGGSGTAANSGIGELNIEALKQTIIEATEDDYDFYRDEEVYSLPKISNKYYAIE